MGKLSINAVKILGVMAENPTRDFYGLELSELTKINYGSAHPVLKRLEYEKLVTAQWEDIDPKVAKRPARKYYRISGVGMYAIKEFLRDDVVPLIKLFPELMM